MYAPFPMLSSKLFLALWKLPRLGHVYRLSLHRVCEWYVEVIRKFGSRDEGLEGRIEKLKTAMTLVVVK